MDQNDMRRSEGNNSSSNNVMENNLYFIHLPGSHNLLLSVAVVVWLSHHAPLFLCVCVEKKGKISVLYHHESWHEGLAISLNLFRMLENISRKFATTLCHVFCFPSCHIVFRSRVYSLFQAILFKAISQLLGRMEKAFAKLDVHKREKELSEI